MTTTACRPFSAFSRKAALDPPDALVDRDARVAAAVELVGQIGQQLGRGHLRIDQVDERRIVLAQRLAEHGEQKRLARAGRAGQQGPAPAVLHGIAELQQRRLVRFTGEIELRIGRVLERLLVKLPIGFVHGGLPGDKVLDGSRITQVRRGQVFAHVGQPVRSRDADALHEDDGIHPRGHVAPGNTFV